MSPVTRVIRYLAAVLALATALVHTVYSEENVGQVQQPLVGGAVLASDTQERLTLLTLNLNGGGVCSASLLRNDWVVTAAHCIDTPARGGGWMTRAASTVSLSANWRTSQTRNAVAIHTFRPLDVAIIQLNRPFSVNESTWHFRQRVWSDGSYRNLAQYNITLFGRGISRFATPRFMSSNDGNYRVGYAKIRRIDDGLYWFPDEVKAAIAGGDSGGPSFTTEAVSSGLIGVHSACTMRCVDGQMCGDWRGPGPAPAGYRSWAWAAATLECADAPIEPAWDRIWQIMQDSVPEEAPAMQVRAIAYGAVKYVRPTMTAENGLTHWVDACREWGQNCGQPAADAFCRNQDAAKPDAVAVKVRDGAGITAVISNGQVCQGSGCGAFEEITCASRAHYEVAQHEGLDDQRGHLEAHQPIKVSPNDPIAGSARMPRGLEAATPAQSRVDPAAPAVPAASAVAVATETRERGSSARATDVASPPVQTSPPAQASPPTSSTQPHLQPQGTRILENREAVVLQPKTQIKGTARGVSGSTGALAPAGERLQALPDEPEQPASPAKELIQGTAIPGTAAAQTAAKIEELVCRGGPALRFEKRGEKVTPSGSAALLAMYFGVAPGAADKFGRGLSHSSCAFVGRTWLPEEPPGVYFEAPSRSSKEREIKRAQHGSAAPAVGPDDAERLADELSMPVYLANPSHYWSFSVTKGHGYFLAGPHGFVKTTLSTATSRSDVIPKMSIARLHNVQVRPSIGGARFRFIARPEAEPTIDLGKQPPVTGRDGLKVLANPITMRAERDVLGGSNAAVNWYAAGTDAQRIKLEQNTEYHYVITVPGSGAVPIQQHFGTFTTLQKVLKVTFKSVHILDDSDDLSDGEGAFTYCVNSGARYNEDAYGENVQEVNNFATGTDVPVNREVVFDRWEDGPLEIAVQGIDDDAIGTLMRGGCGLRAPSRNSSADENVARVHIDTTSPHLAGRRGATGFRMESLPRPRSDWLAFNVLVEVEVLRPLE